MANEKRLIDANALRERKFTTPLQSFFSMGWNDAIDAVMQKAPTVDAVSRCVHDQVRWERDVAMKQLEEHGISFGGIAPDVVKVVRCKDCTHWYDREGVCLKIYSDGTVSPYAWQDRKEDDFCSYGERREGE